MHQVRCFCTCKQKQSYLLKHTAPLKIRRWTKSPLPPEKIVKVNISHAVFSFLNFLMFENGASMLSQNVGKEYLRRAQISLDDLMTQAMVWLHIVQFRAIWLGVVHFGTSYVNLRQPHIWTPNLREKASSSVGVNVVLFVNNAQNI